MMPKVWWIVVAVLLSGGSAWSTDTVPEKRLLLRPATAVKGPAPIIPKTFKPVTAVKLKKPALIKLPPLLPVKPQSVIEAQGPDPARAIDLSDVVEDAALLDDLSEACGWDAHLIFQDKAAGNVFYYLPREFLLSKDESGFNFNVQYNQRSEADQPSVMLSAELAAPQRLGDIQLLKAVLHQVLDLAPGTELKLKAVQGIGAEVDLQALATGLALSAERIHLVPPAHLKQPFRLTLALTQDEVEEVLAQLGREGLAGHLLVKVGEATVPVPIRVVYHHYAGERVAGFDDWLKGRSVASLTNVAGFPVEVQGINAYRLRGGQLERVAKDFKTATVIPPGEERSFRLPPVKQVLDDNVIIAWLSTKLERDCAPCLEEFDQEVRKGVAVAPGEQLKLEAIPSVFDELDLYKIVVRIRSPFFVANGREVQDKEIQLTAEDHQNDEVRLFVPTSRGVNPLLYRYKLLAVTASGQSFEQSEWQDGRSLSQFFGTVQLEELLPD